MFHLLPFSILYGGLRRHPSDEQKSWCRGAHSSLAPWPLSPPQHTAGPFHMLSLLSKPPCSNILIPIKHADLIIFPLRCLQGRCNNRREDFGIPVYVTDTVIHSALAYRVFVCLVRPLYPTEQIKGSSFGSIVSNRWGSPTLSATICKSDMTLLQNSQKPETWGVHHEFILVRCAVF